MSSVNNTASAPQRNVFVKKYASLGLSFSSRVGAEYVLVSLNRAIRWISYQTHRMQLIFHYAKPHSTEWFDHYIDVNYTWTKTGSSHPWERGILNALAIRHNAKVLELCSGDGFNARYFYCEKASSVLGIDINKSAVQHAQRLNSGSNITYKQGNILKDIPTENFDNVIWDASLYMFSDEQLEKVVKNVHERLGNAGIFSGHGAYDFDADNPMISDSIEKLEKLLKSEFENVKIVANDTKDRLSVHFFASDSKLPLHQDWQEIIKASTDMQ